MIIGSRTSGVVGRNLEDGQTDHREPKTDRPITEDRPDPHSGPDEQRSPGLSYTVIRTYNLGRSIRGERATFHFVTILALAAQDPRLDFAPKRVAALNVGVDEVPSDFQRILVESLAAGIQESGDIQVISRDDVVQMLAVTAQRQLAGCDDAACIVEIGGALDVEAVVTANISPAGERWTAVAKLMDMNNARVFRRVSRDVDRESRLPTLMRVLGIEVMGGTPSPELLAELGPERAPPTTSWNVGITAGVALPAVHYFDGGLGGNAINTKTGFLFNAYADFAVAERISVGMLLSLAEYSYGKQLLHQVFGDTPAAEARAVMLDAGGVIKLRFNPVAWLWLRVGVILAYQRWFVGDPRIGDTNGFGAGANAQVAFTVWRGLAIVAETGFFAQVGGGNE